MILAAVAVVQFMVSLDLSVVNVGLPEIAVGLGFTAVGLPWVIHAYALTFGGLLLLGGKAADRYGRRRLLLIGLVLFGVASLAGGLAQAPSHLVAARAVQGVGAAALAPAALSLLTATFPSGRERARAFGIWSAMNAAGGALGVLLGGLLTQFATWRSVMLVNVPMVLLVLALTLRSVTGRAPTTPSGRPDVLGAVLATAGVSVLVLGVVRSEQVGWASAATWLTLAAAMVLLTMFVVVEQRTSRDPLLRLGLLGNRSVAGGNGFNLLLGAALASTFYFVSLYVQQVLLAGPALAGLMILPFALGVIAGTVVAIKVGGRFPARTLLIIGAVVTAVGFAWFAQIRPDGTFWVDVLGPSLVASVGIGLCLGPVVSTATIGVAPAETGTASGLLNTSRQLGASLGLAALGTAAHHRIAGRDDPLSLASGYGLGLGLSAVLLVGAAVVAAAVLPRTPTEEHTTDEEPVPDDDVRDDPTERIHS